jgi:glycosyltransferase involved in cell wall biosynthesis
MEIIMEDVTYQVNSDPFFSIIVVSLNAGIDMKVTMDSIISQKLCEYEVIIKDGGSTDDTLHHIPKDPRIRTIVSKDSGIYDAMNQAMEYCNGQYIYFLNCGDYLINNFTLNLLYKWILLNDFPDIIYGNAIQDNLLCRFPRKLSNFFLYRTGLIHQACFFKRSVFEKWGKYNTSYQVCADNEFLVECSIKYFADIRHFDTVICNYKGNGFSERLSNKRIFHDEIEKIRSSYFTLPQRFFYKLFIKLSLRSIRTKIADNSPVIIKRIYRNIRNLIYQYT